MSQSLRNRTSWIPGVVALVTLVSLGNGGCDWFDDPVEINLEPDTFIEASPSDDHAAGDDATVEWIGQDPDGAVHHYEWAWTLDGVVELGSGETEETSLTLENLERGQHRFKVAAVDDDGDVDPTPASCEFTVERVPRVVLAEFITGRGCPNCPNARDALYIMLREYGLQGLSVVSYHDSTHTLATAETDARIEWYTKSSEVPPMPIVIFDGDWSDHVEGAADSTSAAAIYRQRIDEKRLVGSPLSLEVGGDLSRGGVSVTVRIHRDLPVGPNVLRAVVVEDDVYADLETHIYATRDILEEEVLTVAAAGDSAFVERTFTVEPGWNIDELDVIVFVQNDATQAVYQSGRLRVP